MEESKEPIVITKTESDLVFTAHLMKKYINQQGKVRDLFLYATSKEKGIDAVMLETGDDYIDEIARVIGRLADKRKK